MGRGYIGSFRQEQTWKHGNILRIYNLYTQLFLRECFYKSVREIKNKKRKDRRKKMGYALFTARIMSLQAQKNQYNLKLIQLNDKQNELTNKTTRMQNKNNKIDATQNKASLAGSAIGTIGGFILGGPAGAAIGNLAGNAITSLVNGGIDAGQESAKKYEQAELARQQQEIDTEKQRLETLLQAADQELQELKNQQKTAIKNATPSYVG